MLDKEIYSIIFLPPIILIGILSSYEDFKFSRIRNKFILFGLIYSLSIYLLAWILYILFSRGSAFTGIKGMLYPLIWNFHKWCINLITVTLVAYILWHLKMWGAGDAKLFICFAALIPIGQYSKVYFDYYFASFLLLLTIFIPCTVFLLIKSAIFFLKKALFQKFTIDIQKLVMQSFKKLKKPENGKVLLGFFVLFLFFRIIKQESRNIINKFLPNQNVLLGIFLLFFKKLSKFFKDNTKFMRFLSIFVPLYIILKMIYSGGRFVFHVGNALGRSLLITVLFPAFKKVVDSYIDASTKDIMPFAHWIFLGTLIAWFI